MHVGLLNAVELPFDWTFRASGHNATSLLILIIERRETAVFEYLKTQLP